MVIKSDQVARHTERIVGRVSVRVNRGHAASFALPRPSRSEVVEAVVFHSNNDNDNDLEQASRGLALLASYRLCYNS